MQVDQTVAVFTKRIEARTVCCGMGLVQLHLKPVDTIEALQALLASGVKYALLDPHMPLVGRPSFSASLRTHFRLNNVADSLGPELILFLLNDETSTAIGDAGPVAIDPAAEVGRVYDEIISYPLDDFELMMRVQPYERRGLLDEEFIRKGKILQEANNKVAKEVQQVQELQFRGLPHRPLEAPLDYAWYFEPSDYLSGDNLSVQALDDRWVGFYLLDACGHGVPSAVDALLLSRELQLTFRRAAWYLDLSANPESWDDWTYYPSQIVGRLNARYTDFQQDETIRYATMVLGYIDTHTGRGMLCRAGHPAPIVLRANGAVDHIEDGDPPVGLLEGATYTDIAFKLEPRDRMVLYSDGCLEVRNHNQELFGIRRFEDLLKGHRSQAAGEMLASVSHAVTAFSGQEGACEDDYSLLSIERAISGKSSKPWVSSLRESHTTDKLRYEPLEDEAFRKILLVEDSRSLISVIKRYLTNHRYEVRAVPSAELALSVVETWQPDMVVTDWDLPGKNGLELAQELQTKCVYPPYLIMVSGYANRRELLESLGKACDDFMSKPLKFDELLGRLEVGRRVLHKAKLLADYNNALETLTDRLRADFARVVSIKSMAMPSDCMAKERLCAYGLMSASEFKSSSQVSIWPINATEKAFFVLRIGDYNLLGVFLSFLVELEFHHDACPFIDFDTEQRAKLVAPSQVVRFLTAWLKRHRSETETFEMLYGIVNVPTGQVQLNMASNIDRPSVTEPTEVATNGEDAVVINLSTLPEFGLRLGFDLNNPNKHCGLALNWRDGSTALPAGIPLNDRALLSKAMMLTGFFAPNERPDYSESLVIPIYADLEQFVGLSEQIEGIGLSQGMGEAQAALFRLTLVELGTNVLRHGLRYGDEASMLVYLLKRDNALVTVFTDGGKEVPMAAFQRSADLVSNLGDIPVEDLPEGGFGLTIITTASSRYRYLRKENINYHMLLWESEITEPQGMPI